MAEKQVGPKTASQTYNENISSKGDIISIDHPKISQIGEGIWSKMLSLGLSENVRIIGSKDMLLCKPRSNDRNDSKCHLSAKINLNRDVTAQSDLPLPNSNVFNCQTKPKVKLSCSSSDNTEQFYRTRPKASLSNLKDSTYENDCHTQPKRNTCQTEPKPIYESDISNQSELERMFKRIKDKHSVNKIDKSCKNIAKLSPKSSPRNKRIKSKLQDKNTSPSIKTLLSQNKKVNSIKKKEPNKVRTLIMDLEKPKPRSPIVRKSKKVQICPNQSTILSFYSRTDEKDKALSNDKDRSK